jgi:hypothetical protein
MRAKFIINNVNSINAKDPTWPSEIIVGAPVSKSTSYPEDGFDEDNSFARCRPSGSLSLTITNPNLIGQIKPGDKFYVDFTPVPVVTVPETN